MASSLGRSGSLVGLFTLLSRVFGFVRESAMAAVLGIGPVGGALTFALYIPNFFRRIFGEGAFTAIFLPMYVQTREREGEDASRRLVGVASGALLGLLSFIALFGVGICLFFPREWLSQNWGSLEQIGLTLDFLAVVFPYLVLVCAYAMAMAILNAHGRFAVPAAAPVVQNLVAIAGIGCAAWLGFGELPAGFLIAWFFVLSGVVQLAMQFPGLAAVGALAAPRWAPRDPSVRTISREMAPLILGLGLVQVNLFVDQVIAIAFLGQGGNQYVHLGNRLLQLPIGIIGASAATVTFPLFARLYASGEKNALRFELDRAVRQVAFLALPAAAGMVALAHPIAQTLFGHGKVTAEDIANTAPVIAAFALAVPALCVQPLFARVFYAANDRRTPVRIASVLVFLGAALSWILVKPLGAAGIALGTSITSILNLLLLAFFLPRLGLPGSSSALLSPLLRLVLLAAVCGLASYGTLEISESLGEIVALGAAILSGAAVYFGLCRLLNVPELQEAVRALRRER